MTRLNRVCRVTDLVKRLIILVEIKYTSAKLAKITNPKY
jgi:hypothetical protein